MKLASKTEYLFNCIVEYIDAKVEYELMRHKINYHKVIDNDQYNNLQAKTIELEECINEVLQEKE